jgi:iron(III) transport system ATP-binding protein
MLLKLENISKRYQPNGHFAVENVSLTMNKGESICICGENGSGKTTLLKLIAGAIGADSGYVELLGNRLEHADYKLIPGEPDIVMVSGDQNYKGQFRVHEILSKPVYHLQNNIRDQKMKEVTELFRLEEYLEEYPVNLSAGERQRLSLAVAFLKEPKLLLLDEPFAHLDVRYRQQLRDELVAFVRKRDLSVIFVSHDPAEALSMTSRIVLLYDGALMQQGSPQKLYQQPLNTYVASYFGNANIVYTEDLRKVVAIPGKEEYACIRAEDITLAQDGKSGIMFTVKLALFCGPVYRITVVGNNMELYFYHRDFLPPGSAVSVVINAQRVILLEE